MNWRRTKAIAEAFWFQALHKLSIHRSEMHKLVTFVVSLGLRQCLPEFLSIRHFRVSSVDENIVMGVITGRVLQVTAPWRGFIFLYVSDLASMVTVLCFILANNAPVVGDSDR